MTLSRSGDFTVNTGTALIRKDADALRDMMSEDYSLQHMTGMKQSREVFLKELLTGTFNYYSASHDQIIVHVNGDTARMTGKNLPETFAYRL